MLPSSPVCCNNLDKLLVVKFVDKHSTMVEKVLKILALRHQKNAFSRLKSYSKLLYPKTGRRI